MKKMTLFHTNWITAIAVVATIGFAPLAVSAATLSLAPSNISVQESQRFTAEVAIDPQGETIYTVKVELEYSTDLIEVQSFEFSGDWAHVNQPGYDEIDNDNGTLIKTGGYPGGLSSKATFGTISFQSKAAGTGDLNITADSFVLDRNSEDVLSGAPVTASVEIAEIQEEPTPEPQDAPDTTSSSAPSPPSQQEQPAEEPEEEEEVVEDSTDQESPSTEEPTPLPEEEVQDTQSLLAQVGSFLNPGNVVALAVIALALAYGGYTILKQRKNKKTA